MLSSNLDIDTVWDVLHDHINLTFDTTSFFIALYDYERDQLTLPLVSEDGLRVEHEPIPVCWHEPRGHGARRRILRA